MYNSINRLRSENEQFNRMCLIVEFFNGYVELHDSGRMAFYRPYDGKHSISKYFTKSTTPTTLLAHEFGHHMYYYFWKEDDDVDLTDREQEHFAQYFGIKLREIYGFEVYPNSYEKLKTYRLSPERVRYVEHMVRKSLQKIRRLLADM